MNADIANILKGYTDTLAFKDRSAGLVKAISFANPNDEEKNFAKVIPIACNVSAKDCLAKKYDSLVPDSRLKSIMYWEEVLGASISNDQHPDFGFSSTLRLVVWLNLAKLGKTECSLSSLAVVNILNVIPTKFFNNGIYTRIQVTPVGEVIKDKSIFSKYTYDENTNQFLMFPYDYFAIDFKISYVIPKSCIETWANGTAISCPTN